MTTTNRYRLLIYYKTPKCFNCIEESIKKHYELEIASNKNSFFSILNKTKIDAVIICMGCVKESFANEVTELTDAGLSFNRLPVILCISQPDQDFFHKSSELGINNTLFCSLESKEIIRIIDDAIDKHQLKIFLEKQISRCFEKTPYANKIIHIILASFPKKLSKKEIAIELNISPDWFNDKCKEAFNISYTKLIRAARIYHATRLIYMTNLDNTEIALLLNYTEESSLARDFRKVLNLSPTEVRKTLSISNPLNLFDLHNQYK